MKNLAIWKNLVVIAAIMLLGFVPSQIGMWIIEHEGWAGRVFGHHGADLDAVSSKFLIVGGGVWLWILLDSIWLRWFAIRDVMFGGKTSGQKLTQLFEPLPFWAGLSPSRPWCSALLKGLAI